MKIYLTNLIEEIKAFIRCLSEFNEQNNSNIFLTVKAFFEFSYWRWNFHISFYKLYKSVKRNELFFPSIRVFKEFSFKICILKQYFLK